MEWSYSRYLRLRLDCGLDPYYRLMSLRKRRREEKKARRNKKIGRPRIWTLRQAASAINSWGIDRKQNFPRHDEYRADRPEQEFPHVTRFDDAADECDLPGAPIQITDSGVELLSNRQ